MHNQAPTGIPIFTLGDAWGRLGTPGDAWGRLGTPGDAVGGGGGAGKKGQNFRYDPVLVYRLEAW